MHVDTRYFLIFQNILGTKNFEITGTFFQALLSTVFYKKSDIFNETFLILSSLACNIFSKKKKKKNPAGFCSLINLKLKKLFTPLLNSFALSKNKNSESCRLIIGSSLPFQCYLSLSLSSVCLVHLHHFYQFVFHRKNFYN